MPTISRPHRSPSRALRAHAWLLLLIVAVVLLPNAAACGPSGPIATLDVPACDVVPGLADAPAPPKPLDALGAPIVPASTTVGVLPGAGTVTPTGEYTYRLPLDVPAGRAGMAPTLALVYASRGRNGHLGVGWQLEATSEIARCPRTFALDGVSDGVRLDDRDALCLDGHRLVAIGDFQRPTCTGTEYRTEDEPFARIASCAVDGDVLRFVVWTKEGRIRRYDERFPSSDKVPPFAWLLSEDEDRAGNVIQYHHRITGTEYYPLSIAYTGQKNMLAAPRREVKFVYTPRPDAPFSVVGGLLLQATQRLAAVEMYAPDANDVRALAWRYELDYDPSPGSGVSRLVRVAKCGAQGGCLQARTFVWESSTGPQYAPSIVEGWLPATPPDPADAPRPIVLDLDGDGRDEILTLDFGNVNDVVHLTDDPAQPLAVQKPVSGSLSGITTYDAKPVDFDGDGRTELVVGDLSTQACERVGLVGSLQVDAPLLVGTPLPKQDCLGAGHNPLYVIDLDGDGLPDVVRAECSAKTCTWRYLLNATASGGVLGPAQQVLGGAPIRPLPGGASFATDWGAHRGTLYAGDTGGLDVWGFGLDPLDPVHPVRTDRISGSSLVAVADMNGDGVRASVAYDDLQNTLCTWDAWAFPTECLSVERPDTSDGIEYWHLQVADLDGDGREEVMLGHTIGAREMLVFRLDAANHLQPVDLDLPDPDAIGDFDGDGLLDLARRGLVAGAGWSDAWTVYRATRSTSDRLVAVADEGGAAARELVAYSTAWSPAPVQTQCQYPQRCMRQGFVVVREHQLDQGEEVGAYQRRLFTYEDPRFDVRGRGFLGFGTVRAWDPDRLAETITTYDHQTSVDGPLHPDPTQIPGAPPKPPIASPHGIYPGALRPKTIRRAVVIEPARHLARIEQIDTTYALQRFHADRTWAVLPSAWTSLEWEEEVMILPDAAKVHLTHIDGANEETALRTRRGEYQYDNFGNVTYAKTETLHGVTAEVVSTYEIREKDWLVGLLQSEQVTVSQKGSKPAPRHMLHDYDARGLVCHTWIEKDDPDPSIPEVLTYVHDQAGLLVARTASAVGAPHRMTHVAYDDAEHLFRAAVWNDLGHAEHVRHHPALGVVLAAEDANGVRVQAQHDELGRVRQVVRDGAGKVSVQHTLRTSGGAIVGASVRVDDEAAGSTRTDYDVLGRVVGRGHAGFDGAWIEEATEYDVRGRVVFASRPGVGAPSGLGTTYAYDGLDRPTRVTGPDNASVRLEQSFFTTRTIDPMQRASYVVRDRDGRVAKSVQVKGSDRLATHYHYDAFGQLREIVDPKGHTITTSYDRRGRRAARLDPDAGATSWSYNGFGDLVTQLRGAKLTTYHHDELGRVTQVDDEDGVATYTWDTAAHGLGKLAQTKSGDGTTYDLTYDAAGRVVGQTWTVDGEPFEIATSYGSVGRLATVSYPKVPGRPRFVLEHSYTYPTRYLEKVRDFGGPTTYWQADARNAEDRLTQATLGNGVVATRTYEPLTGRLASIEASAASGPVLAVAYGYDADGKVRDRFDGVAKRADAYEYDALHRLVSWTRSSLSLAGGPNVPPVLVPIHATEYGYDDLGNLTEVRVDGAVTESPTYGQGAGPHARTDGGTLLYDDRGRQTHAPGRDVPLYTAFDLPRTVVTASGLTSFLYDAAGTRVKKSGPDGEVVTIGGLYERRIRGGKTLHVFYVHGAEGPVAQVVVTEGVPGQETEYLHTDALGSLGAVSDASGAPVQALHYEPFGGRRDQDGNVIAPMSPSDVEVGFAGLRHDDDLGLLDQRGRVYDPAQRRFLTPDPHVPAPLFGQSFNRYSYVVNDPVNRIDPSGFDDIGWEIYGGGGGTTGTGFGFGFGFGWGGPSNAVTPILPGSGSSGRRMYSAGPVIATEGTRVISLPTGPSAPAMAITGPVLGAWLTSAVKAAGLGAPGAPIAPLGAPSAPLTGPLSAPGPFVPNAFAPGSFVEPPPPGVVPVQVPGPAAVPARAPGVGGILGGLAFILSMGSIFDGDVHPTVATGVGGAAGVGAPAAGEAEAVRGPPATLDLAKQIASVDPAPPWVRTIGLLETREGPTLVAAGARDLSLMQKLLAQQLGLTVVPDLPGFHAEETLLHGAGQLGLTPTKGVTTWNVCERNCKPVITDLGGWVNGQQFGF